MTKPKQITVKVPQYWAVDAGDYHEFDDMKVNYRYIGIPVKFTEVGCDGFYHAVFYVGEQPKEFIKAQRLKYAD